MTTPISIGAHRAAEREAFATLEKERSMLVVNMFAGTKLKFGALAAAENGKGLLSSGKAIASNSYKLATGSAKGGPAVSLPGLQTAVTEFVRQCADVDNIQEVVAVIGGDVLAELIGEITPFLGVLWSAKKLGDATKAVVEDGHNLYKHAEYREGFRPGDPQMAADAVKIIIKRDLAKHSVDLARQTTVTGAKIAGLFADLGVATTVGIGMANALASLGLKLFAIGVDIKDMRAGNRRLASPDTLDATVFQDCPILGCYLLTCADTSSVAFFSDRHGHARMDG